MKAPLNSLHRSKLHWLLKPAKRTVLPPPRYPELDRQLLIDSLKRVIGQGYVGR